MTTPRPLPPTLALYELQVDDALRALARSSEGFVPTPPFQTVMLAFHAGKSAHRLALELMESLRHPSDFKKRSDDGENSLF